MANGAIIKHAKLQWGALAIGFTLLLASLAFMRGLGAADEKISSNQKSILSSQRSVETLLRNQNAINAEQQRINGGLSATQDAIKSSLERGAQSRMRIEQRLDNLLLQGDK